MSWQNPDSRGVFVWLFLQAPSCFIGEYSAHLTRPLIISFHLDARLFWDASTHLLHQPHCWRFIATRHHFDFMPHRLRAEWSAAFDLSHLFRLTTVMQGRAGRIWNFYCLVIFEKGGIEWDKTQENKKKNERAEHLHALKTSLTEASAHKTTEVCEMGTYRIKSTKDDSERSRHNTFRSSFKHSGSCSVQRIRRYYLLHHTVLISQMNC